MSDQSENPASPETADASTVEIPSFGGEDSQPAMPPVQPPSSAFILQLFLIPMLIVGIVVMVWLTFSWLAHMGSDPHDLVRDLEKLNKGSWQKALTLSNLLRDRKNDPLKDDSELARDLAAVLEAELEAAKMSPERIKLRFFLCHCLGEFRIREPLPSLVKAARLERDPVEAEVRLAAIAALAKLSLNLGQERMREEKDVLAVLNEASRVRETNPARQMRNRLRAAAAFALGMVGDPRSLDRLDEMLLDADASVRFNAATGMARHGDPRALPVLMQMLDLADPEAVAGAETPEQQEQQRVLVVKNGIEAVRQFARQVPRAERKELEVPLERIIDSNLPADLRLRAKAALQELRD